MALSTQYSVSFEFADDTLSNRLKAAVADTTEGVFSPDGIVSLLCTEAQLPSVSSLTGQTNGLYLGEGQVNYSYGKLFTDVSLGWICDRDMTPMKFLQEWHDSQFTFEAVRKSESSLTKDTRAITNRVNFPSNYQAVIKIEKNDLGPEGRERSMTYTLLNAFPYSIDATPVSYGTSQVLNVSASFYYSKFFIDHI